MRRPTNTTQEVLFEAIIQGSVSLMDFPYLSGFRTRVSNLKLRYGIEFKNSTVEKKNKYGRKIRYVKHELVDVEKAKSIYNLMTRI